MRVAIATTPAIPARERDGLDESGTELLVNGFNYLIIFSREQKTEDKEARENQNTIQKV